MVKTACGKIFPYHCIEKKEDHVETPKKSGSSVDNNLKNMTQTRSNLRSNYIQIYGKSRIAEKTIKKEKIL